VEYQLRMYEIKPGEMDAWIEEWRREVVPLRRDKGFETVVAWRAEDHRSFVWVLSHDGDFAAADVAYYESAERAAVHPDPARHLASSETRMVRKVL
jgi:hypothetical protein